MTGFDSFSFEMESLSLMFQGANCSGNIAVAHRQLTTILIHFAVGSEWEAPIYILEMSFI